MCDVCKTVEGELSQYLNELEEKYPGVEVEGRPAPRGHHVFIALYVQFRERYIREMEELDALNPPSPEDASYAAAVARLLGGSISEGN